MLPRRLVLLTVLTCSVPFASANACNIPVFRYALERWRAERDEDLYRVLVFHGGPLAPGQEATLATLRKLSHDESRRANFVVEAVDVPGKMADDVRAIWEAQKNPPLPWVVLRYPDSDVKRPSPWAGPLNEETVRLLTDSPARKEVARRILRGDSVVWVVLESGDKAADDAAARLLQAELTRQEKLVELPEGLGEGTVKLLSELPVRIAFTLVRVSRTDPAERAFVGMLLHSEDDLPGEKKPMAFPVFGRGRSLEALVGKGINPDMIRSTSQFLCGACSCQVKRLNPGFDLLMAVEWDELLAVAAAEEPEKLSVEGQSVPIPSGQVSPSEKGDAAVAPEGVPWRRVGQNLVVFALTGCGLGIVFLIARAVARGRGESGERRAEP